MDLRGAGALRCAGEYSDGCQAPCGDGYAAYRSAKPAAGAAVAGGAGALRPPAGGTGEPGGRPDGAARPDRGGDVSSAGAGGGAGAGPQRTGYIPNAVRGRDPHGGQALCRGGPHRAPPAGHGRRPVPAVCGSSVSAGLHL